MRTKITTRVWAACLVTTVALMGAAAARADDAAAFYKGRTVTIIVGQEPGTGFDIYSRTLARHFGRLIPGNPQIVVQNMPGASGVNAGNYLYNIAPKDGTAIGTFSQNVVTEPLFGNAAARYDATKFIWLGNIEESAAICGVEPAAGVETFEQMRTKEVLFGATGPTGPLGLSSRALNGLAGTRIKIVYGYKGSSGIKLAMQNGEVQGICGLPMSTIKAFWKDMLDAGTFKPIIQLSGRRAADLANVPHIDDDMKTDEQRLVAGLMFGLQALGRIYASPPGTPDDRSKALTTAFAATMADAEFIADAERTRIDVISATGAEVAATIARFYATPAAAITRAKQIMQGE